MQTTTKEFRDGMLYAIHEWTRDGETEPFRRVEVSMLSDPTPQRLTLPKGTHELEFRFVDFEGDLVPFNISDDAWVRFGIGGELQPVVVENGVCTVGVAFTFPGIYGMIFSAHGVSRRTVEIEITE